MEAEREVRDARRLAGTDSPTSNFRALPIRIIQTTDKMQHCKAGEPA
jgi:hypothetical protein